MEGVGAPGKQQRVKGGQGRVEGWGRREDGRSNGPNVQAGQYSLAEGQPVRVVQVGAAAAAAGVRRQRAAAAAATSPPVPGRRRSTARPTRRTPLSPARGRVWGKASGGRAGGGRASARHLRSPLRPSPGAPGGDHGAAANRPTSSYAPPPPPRPTPAPAPLQKPTLGPKNRGRPPWEWRHAGNFRD